MSDSHCERGRLQPRVRVKNRDDAIEERGEAREVDGDGSAARKRPLRAFDPAGEAQVRSQNESRYTVYQLPFPVTDAGERLPRRSRSS
jgi:hypothetical protein